MLITAVWIQVGTLNTKQAVGGQSQAETEKKATLKVAFQKNGDLLIEAKDSRLPAKLASIKISNESGKVNLANLDQALEQIRAADPAVSTALFHPMAGSVYEEIMDVMDRFKKKGLINLGMNPL